MCILTVGLDVDLTAYDTLKPWLKWHKEHTGVAMDTSVHDAYNLQTKMSIGAPHGYDPYEFWNKGDIFSANDVQIEPGVQEFVARMTANDIGVVVVSTCTDGHREDKRAAVARDLPSTPFIDSHEKWLLPIDVMIDDNPKIHEGFYRQACDGRTYQGFYYQGVVNRHFKEDRLAMHPSVLRTDNWQLIGDHILDMAYIHKIASRRFPLYLPTRVPA